MATLASLEDVKEVLASLQAGYDGTADARLQDVLDATEDWIRRTYGIKDYITNSPTSVSENFFGRKDGDILVLSDPNPTNVSITFTDFGTDGPIVLQSPRFIVMDNGKVLLRFKGLVAPFEGAVAKSLPQFMNQITVTYAPSITTAGSVPPALNEAVAIAAAHSWKQQEADLAGLTTESISAYSYTRDKMASHVILPPRARQLLRPFARRTHIEVT